LAVISNANFNGNSELQIFPSPDGGWSPCSNRNVTLGPHRHTSYKWDLISFFLMALVLGSNRRDNNTLTILVERQITKENYSLMRQECSPWQDEEMAVTASLALYVESVLHTI